MRLLVFVAVFAVVQPLHAAEPDVAQAAKDRTVVETLLRLKGVDVNSSANWKNAVLRHLETVKGTPRYVELIEQLKVRGAEDELFRLATEESASTLGARAATHLMKIGEANRFRDAVHGADEPLALKALAALANLGDDRAVEIALPFVTHEEKPAAIHVAAAAVVAKNKNGQQRLLELARANKLPPETKLTAANALLSSSDEALRREASKYLTLPATASGKPLPPIAELTKMRGDATLGAKLFQTTGTCAKCHKVRGEGKEVGPDLSEIGGKLTREAMFQSILDPSAGISHNYESYSVVTSDGVVLTGLLISRSDQAVTIRTAEAIDKTIATNDVEELQKLAVSIMPADLQRLLSAQELVDVVEFLTTLKKK